MPPSSLLVVGGEEDPNVAAVARAAEAAGRVCVRALQGSAQAPRVRWDLGSGSLELEGQVVCPTGAFVRYDVFSGTSVSQRQRASALNATLLGWLATHPEVEMLNRGYLGRTTNKLATLDLARRMGLRVPVTEATNDLASVRALRERTRVAAKPVCGGGYCYDLDEILTDVVESQGAAPSPAIVQELVDGRDVRMYRVGRETFVFNIVAAGVDYRRSRSQTIEPFGGLPEATQHCVTKMMRSMGLDWAAADFRVDEATGEPVFLEINSNPMFSAFDPYVDGAITREIVRVLSAGTSQA